VLERAASRSLTHRAQEPVPAKRHKPAPPPPPPPPPPPRAAAPLAAATWGHAVGVPATGRVPIPNPKTFSKKGEIDDDFTC